MFDMFDNPSNNNNSHKQNNSNLDKNLNMDWNFNDMPNNKNNCLINIQI